MNRQEHLLIIMSEECSELAQDISKALRFGVHEQRDLPTNNLDRMQVEFNQLIAMRDMLWDEGICLRDDYDVRRKKRVKVEKYLKYSEECGTLTKE